MKLVFEPSSGQKVEKKIKKIFLPELELPAFLIEIVERN